jgi:hypothetical protein
MGNGKHTGSTLGTHIRTDKLDSNGGQFTAYYSQRAAYLRTQRQHGRPSRRERVSRRLLPFAPSKTLLQER